MNKVKEYFAPTVVTLLIGGMILAPVYDDLSGSSTSEEQSCEENSISFESESVDAEMLPDTEFVTVQEGVDGTEEICSDSDGNELSRETITEPTDEIVHNGVASIPESYDGLYDEQNYIADYEDNGTIDEQHFGTYVGYDDYEEVDYTVRTGAACEDGSYSYATGRGACSHHGGVSEWLYN